MRVAEQASPPRPGRDRSGTVARARFWFALGGLTGLGLAIRWVNVLVWRPTVADCEGFDGCFEVAGDALYGHLQGELIAKGEWFASSAAFWAFGDIRPGAGDPPLYGLFLGLVSALHGTGGWGARLVALLLLGAAVAAVGLLVRRFVGARQAQVALIVAGALAAAIVLASVAPDSAGTAHRLASGVLGASGVALVGVLARQLAGDRAGLIAAAGAAVYPMLWINDGMLLSEALYVPMAAVAMLAGYRFWRAPTTGSAAVLGVAIALAALTRAEAILLYLFMVVPLAWGLSRRFAQRRMGTRAVVAAGAAGLAVMLPWFAFNLVRFEEPTVMTTGTGAVLSAGSCDTAYYGEFVGYYAANCFQEYVDAGKAEWPDPEAVDESEHDLVAREAAVDYIGDHLGRLPAVMVFRMGRMWDLYRPGQNALLNYQVEGRGETASKTALWTPPGSPWPVPTYFFLVPFALFGVHRLWRRGLPLSPLLSMFATVTVTAALSFGVTRYRVPAEVALLVLAAVGVEVVLGRWWPVDDRGTLVRERDRPMSDPGPEHALNTELPTRRRDA